MSPTRHTPPFAHVSFGSNDCATSCSSVDNGIVVVVTGTVVAGACCGNVTGTVDVAALTCVVVVAAGIVVGAFGSFVVVGAMVVDEVVDGAADVVGAAVVGTVVDDARESDVDDDTMIDVDGSRNVSATGARDNGSCHHVDDSVVDRGTARRAVV